MIVSKVDWRIQLPIRIFDEQGKFISPKNDKGEDDIRMPRVIELRVSAYTSDEACVELARVLEQLLQSKQVTL